MDITDLMIGDVLLYKATNKSVQITKIETDGPDVFFDDPNCDGMYEGGSIEKYEPIPLTTDILEKNGITFTNEFFNGYNLMQYRNGEYSIEDHCSIKFKYVHELQHVLKVCGIDKKIVL